jgi:hypothetical protein
MITTLVNVADSGVESTLKLPCLARFPNYSRFGVGLAKFAMGRLVKKPEHCVSFFERGEHQVGFQHL